MENSALTVNEGVPQPPVVNPNVAALLKKRPTKQWSVAQYVEGIRKGDTTLLAQTITLAESTLPQDRQKAQEVIAACLPYTGNALRIGITGVPGVGKSTFIEAFGKYVIALGHKLAVLAIDPSSERTKGSILGDKTRMEQLANHPKAFIRPSPSGGSLGGVARKTREAMMLCEAAGYDVIFIETVGVGQSETAVHSMTDFFLLLMLSGAGDGLQGIKRGIMEMSDLLVINKADGSNIEKAQKACLLYQSALHMFPPSPSGWVPQALTASAIEETGLQEVLAQILRYEQLTKANGYFEQRRREQAVYWMRESVAQSVLDAFYQRPQIAAQTAQLEARVANGEIDSFQAARKLISLIK